jgi:ribose-phosphate pyrophosphokinase
MFKIVKNVDHRNPKYLSFKEFVFPGGEVSVKLNTKEYSYRDFKSDTQTIIANIHNSDDVMKLAMLKDALHTFDETPINLFMPYVPYARQDRECDSGESFSLKVFGDIINGLNFNKITIVDPHSNVCGKSVFNNLKVITQLDIVSKWIDLTNRGISCKLISPDAGSNKKTSDIAKYFNHRDFVRADKLRDLSNGQIKETIVYCDDFKGQDILCPDDICDGATTFIKLAEVCKSKNCGKFVLYVTHGIFSKGLDIIFNSGIDEIYTTDSFYNDTTDIKNVNVFNLEKAFYDII